MPDSSDLPLVLVDTVKWIDNDRRPSTSYQELRKAKRLAVHECVIAEYSLGSIGKGDARESKLANLTGASLVCRAMTQAQILAGIDVYDLGGCGLCYVDLHLFLTARRDGLHLWTRDKRLIRACERHGVELF